MELKLVKQGDYLGTKCDFYQNKDTEILMSRTQLGYALGYKDPNKAIENIHARYANLLEGQYKEFSPPQIGGNKYIRSNIFMYNEHGIFTVVRKSRTKIADDYFSWVYNTIQEIKKNGFYVATEIDDKWLGIRSEGKKIRKEETDSIKLFVEYAKANGSGNAERYYTSLTNLARTKLNIPKGLEKNDMSQKQLRDVMALETVIGMKLPKLINDSIEYHKIYENVKELINAI